MKEKKKDRNFISFIDPAGLSGVNETKLWIIYTIIDFLIPVLDFYTLFSWL